MPTGPKSALVALVCVAAAALVLLPTSPVFQPVPGRDSGAFLAVARAILDGARPYVDVWDHKGPVLFLLNAAGLLLPLPGIWGVWVLRVALLGLAAWSGLCALSIPFGRAPAAAATALVLANVAVFVEDGNFTEEYALGFGLLALAGARSGRVAVVGALGAGAFLLRQNLVGTFAVLVAALAFERGRAEGPAAAAGTVARAFGGAAAVAIPVALALGGYGALGAWWDATFVYNAVYASGGLPGHIAATLTRVLNGSTAPFVFLLVLCWAEAGRRLLAGRSGDMRTLLLFAFASFPVEIVSASLSGNAYLHYYLPWLVPGCVLLASAARSVEGTVRSSGRASIPYLAPVALLGAIALGSWANLFANAGTHGRPNAVVRLLEERTGPGDTVLIWGAEAGLLVAADRRAPGPYLYAYPLVKTGYAPYRDVAGYLRRMQSDPPRLIVDTSTTNPLVPPLDRARRESWRPADPGYVPGEDLEPLFSWIEARYRPEWAVGPGTPWIVYVPLTAPAGTR